MSTSFETALKLNIGLPLNAQVNETKPNMYFEMEVVKGTNYIFQTMGDGDTYGYLYDSNKNLIEENDDDGNDYNPLISFTASETGIVYGMIRAYSSADKVDFIASLTEMESISGDSFETALKLDVGFPLSAQVISTNPKVYFKMDVVKGVVYTFQVMSDGDTYGYLYDSNRNVLAENDDDGSDSNPLIRFTATETGIVYGMVRAYTASNTIDFITSLTEAVVVAGDSFESALPLSLDVTENGLFFPTLTEIYYVIELEVGNLYSVEHPKNFSFSIFNESQNSENYKTIYGDVTNKALFESTTSIMYVRLTTWDEPDENGLPYHLIAAKDEGKEVIEVSFTPDYLRMRVGYTLQLTAMVSPPTAIDKSVTWSSSNPQVATITQNGLIRSVGVGTSTITLTSNGSGIQYMSSLTVSLFEGAGTVSTPYLIFNSNDLKSIGMSMNTHYRQMDDIDLKGIDWKHIQAPTHSQFQGSYDGNGFKIKNLTINEPEKNYVGLFGEAIGLVKNVTIINANVTGRNNVGALAGRTLNVDNCHVTGKVVGREYVGGLTGLSLSNMVNSSADCEVIGDHTIGGLVGVASNLNLRTCCSYSNVMWSGTQVNTSDHTDNVGGLIGTLSASNVSNCYATGKVFMHESGLVTWWRGRNFGGLIGDISDRVTAITIRNCYASGDVFARTDIAGLIGYIPTENHVTIQDCYVLNNVVGRKNDMVGDSTHYLGDVTAVFRNGGLSNREIIDCARLSTFSFHRDREEYYGTFNKFAQREISPTEAKQQSAYTGWDFNAIWEIVEGMYYPTLISIPVIREDKEKTTSEGHLNAIALDDLTIVSRFLMMLKKISEFICQMKFQLN